MFYISRIHQNICVEMVTKSALLYSLCKTGLQPQLTGLLLTVVSFKRLPARIYNSELVLIGSIMPIRSQAEMEHKLAKLLLSTKWSIAML